MTRTEIDEGIRDISSKTGIKMKPGFDSQEYQELLDYLVRRRVQDYSELSAILFAGLSVE